MNRKYVHLITGIIIIALSLFYAFRGVSADELINALSSVKYLQLLPAVLLVILSYLFRAMRWRYLVRSVKDVRTSDLFSPLMIGFMANMLPARAGEFIRAYLLSKKERISFSSSFATIFIERLFDLVVVILLLVGVLLLMPEVFTHNSAAGGRQVMDQVKIFGIVSFSFCLFIFIFSALLQFKNDWAMKMVGFFVGPLPGKLGEKIILMVHSFTAGLKIIRDPRGLTVTVLLSLVIWATFITTYYPLYRAFDIETKLPVVSSLIVLCLTVAVFITVAPTPGFLGSYHLGCVAALHGIFGIQKAVALSYGIVAWLLAMGLTVAIGAVYAIKENISFGEFSAAKERIE